MDLNPIRAGMAATPEGSDYTSIKRRIEELKSATSDKPTPSETTAQDEAPTTVLVFFVGNPREPMPRGLPFAFMDYLDLLDWTGRSVRDDKRGSISEDTPPILQRLRIEPQEWLQLTTRFEEDFCNLVGRPDSLPDACAALGLNWARGTSHCRAMFPT